MSEIYFGSVALFYSAGDTLEPDASYDGKNARQEQTKRSIACLRNYFKEHSVAPTLSKRTSIESAGSSVDKFFGR
ncbi:hypothetical protein D3C72_2449250 [compost metagenome]